MVIMVWNMKWLFGYVAVISYGVSGYHMVYGFTGHIKKTNAKEKEI